MDLSKLVVEGFVVSFIRATLKLRGTHYEKEEQSLALLERLINSANLEADNSRLTALRTIQEVRTNAKGHATAHADKLAHDSIAEHGSFTQHFRSVCPKAVIKLQLIAGLFV